MKPPPPDKYIGVDCQLLIRTQHGNALAYKFLCNIFTINGENLPLIQQRVWQINISAKPKNPILNVKYSF